MPKTHWLTKEAISRVLLYPDPRYVLGGRIGMDPGVLGAVLKRRRKVYPDDERIIKLAAELGLPVEQAVEIAPEG